MLLQLRPKACVTGALMMEPSLQSLKHKFQASTYMYVYVYVYTYMYFFK